MSYRRRATKDAKLAVRLSKSQWLAAGQLHPACYPFFSVAAQPESRCAATAEYAEYAEKNRPRSASPSAYSAYFAVGLRVRYSFLAHVPVAGGTSYNEKDELPPPCNQARQTCRQTRENSVAGRG